MLPQQKTQTAAAGLRSGACIPSITARFPKRHGGDRNVWRPTIDIEQVRASWNRADQFFAAIACRNLDAIQNAYGDDAEIAHPVIGLLRGPLVRKAWLAFLKKTPDLTLSYQICHAGVALAEVEWTAQHRFFENDRPIIIHGTTLLRFSEGRITFQCDSFSRRLWFRQALGPKGLILSFIPGWSKFLEFEVRRSLDLIETGR
jgi:SnoaL-like domain